jgi:hypothetical protein
MYRRIRGRKDISGTRLLLDAWVQRHGAGACVTLTYAKYDKMLLEKRAANVN